MKFAIPEMESNDAGDVVPPIPMLPAPFITKCVADEDPTTNSGTPVPRAFAFTERRPHGVVEEPIPTRPACERKMEEVAVSVVPAPL